MASTPDTQMKITFRGENYMRFGDHIPVKFTDLKMFCLDHCEDRDTFDVLRYYWIDEDGDEIRIDDVCEYDNFMHALNRNKKGRLYVDVQQNAMNDDGRGTTDDDRPVGDDAAVQQERPVHRGVTCDVCDQRIVGHRYKCLICYDYDLCMDCEAKYRHKDHLMMRIPKPEMLTMSRPTMYRIFEKVRSYATRVTNHIEEHESSTMPVVVDQPVGNEATGDGHSGKRANAREMHRSKRSEDRTDRRSHAESKPFRCFAKNIVRKPNAAEPGPSGSEPRSSRMTLEDMSERWKEVLFWYTDPANVNGSTTTRAKEADSTAHGIHKDTVGAAFDIATAAAKAAAEATEKAELAAHQALLASGHAKDVPPAGVQRVQQASNAPLETPLESVHPWWQVPTMGNAPLLNGGWPTQDNLAYVSQKMSKLLDPFGISLEIRQKDSMASDTPTSTSVNDNQNEPQPSEAEATDIPSNETVKTNNGGVQNNVESREENEAKVAESSTPVTNPLESDAVVDPKPSVSSSTEKPDAQDETRDRSRLSSSSGSLLTDDDQDLLDASSSGDAPKSGSKTEKTAWTLIDFPQGNDDTPIAPEKIVPQAIAKLLADYNQVSQEENKPEPQQSSSRRKEKSSKIHESKPSTSGAGFDYESLGKIFAKHREDSVDDEKQQQKEKKSPSPSNTPPPPPSSSVSVERSKSARTAKSSRQSPPKDTTVYSGRPHVNHAIHTMMTMGFSNTNGWLTQLLESLNGDIPKALDMLLQHRH